MAHDEVIGKVYEHPILGRTVCFEGEVKMDDCIQVWKIEEDRNVVKVSEKILLDFFGDLIPLVE